MNRYLNSCLPCVLISLVVSFHCSEAARVGADISTVPFGIIKKMAEHPLTDKGMELFLNDWFGTK